MILRELENYTSISNRQNHTDMNTKTIFTVCLSLLAIGVITAQPGNPTAPAPFGFVELLIGAGAAFGGYKAYKNKKEQE